MTRCGEQTIEGGGKAFLARATAVPVTAQGRTVEWSSSPVSAGPALQRRWCPCPAHGLSHLDRVAWGFSLRSYAVPCRGAHSVATRILTSNAPAPPLLLHQLG